MIRVIVADDHHLVRQGLIALLQEARDIKVVGEAHDGLDLMRMAGELQPDVLVVDIAMPGMNGIEVARRVQQEKLSTRVVLLSVHSDETLVREALRAGVRGYLLKQALKEDLIRAVRGAHQGETFLSPEISKLALEEVLGHQGSSELQRLSPREREVLQLIAEGHTNKRIAQRLSVSEKTIEKHRANLMAKLQLRDVTALVRFAIKHRLVFLEPEIRLPSLSQ